MESRSAWEYPLVVDLRHKTYQLHQMKLAVHTPTCMLIGRQRGRRYKREPAIFLNVAGPFRACGRGTISRILCRSSCEKRRRSFLWDPDCSGPRAAYPRASVGPTVEEQHRCPAPHALLFGLAPGDACRPAVSPRPRWALTPPFHPCLIRMSSCRWVVLSLSRARDSTTPRHHDITNSAIGGVLSVAPV